MRCHICGDGLESQGWEDTGYVCDGADFLLEDGEDICDQRGAVLHHECPVGLAATAVSDSSLSLYSHIQRQEEEKLTDFHLDSKH